nr:hypothetical protein [Rhodococcus erythropolis]
MARFPTSERFVRWSAEHARGVDICIATVAALFSVVVAVEASPLAVFVSLGMTVPLAWRRSRPELSGMVIARLPELFDTSATTESRCLRRSCSPWPS